MSGMSRRKVLGGVVTAVAGVSGAGCIEDSEEDNEATSEPESDFSSVLDEIKGQQRAWLKDANDTLIEEETYIDNPLYDTDVDAELFHADTGERVDAEAISASAVEQDRYSMVFSVETGEDGVYSDLEDPVSEHSNWAEDLGYGLQVLASAAIGYPTLKKERAGTVNPELYAAFEEGTADITVRMYDADGNDIDVTFSAEKVETFATMFEQKDNTDVFESIQYYVMDRLEQDY